MKIKKEAVRGHERQEKIQTNRIIPRLCKNIKEPAYKAAILAQAPYKVNGYITRLLLIHPQSFRLDRSGWGRGVRHVSGVYFPLDRMNFKTAKQFLSKGIV